VPPESRVVVVWAEAADSRSLTTYTRTGSRAAESYENTAELGVEVIPDGENPLPFLRRTPEVKWALPVDRAQRELGWEVST